MMRSRQSGMTLLELMIASSLGIILSYFIMNIMISSARTAAISEGIAQAQETGRLVMAWMNDSIINSGYNSNYLSNTSAGFYPVASLCSSNIIPPSNNAHCSFNSNTHTAGGDRLAVRRMTGGDTPSTRDLQTCGGETLSTTITNARNEVVDVYWVALNNTDADASNNYQLMCATYNGSGVIQGSVQAIANGIESMHFLVGIGSNAGETFRFVSPANVSNWSDVVAVRIALLVREFGDNTLTVDRRAYGLLDADPVIYNDGVARFVQNGTIWFPNTRKM